MAFRKWGSAGNSDIFKNSENTYSVFKMLLMLFMIVSNAVTKLYCQQRNNEFLEVRGSFIKQLQLFNNFCRRFPGRLVWITPSMAQSRTLTSAARIAWVADITPTWRQTARCSTSAWPAAPATSAWSSTASSARTGRCSSRSTSPATGGTMWTAVPRRTSMTWTTICSRRRNIRIQRRFRLNIVSIGCHDFTSRNLVNHGGSKTGSSLIWEQ